MAEATGRSLLSEIETGSLKDLLDALKLSHQQSQGLLYERTGDHELDELWYRQDSEQLQISGRYKTLLYRIISNTVSAPRNGAVLVIDTDGKFDITKLDCGFEDMKHVWIIRTRNGVEDVQQALKDGIKWLTYEQNTSKGRDLALKVVSGGPGGGKATQDADVVGGWRGWLRVESGAAQDIEKFPPGYSAEEALREAEQRQAAVDHAGWSASSEAGTYRWA